MQSCTGARHIDHSYYGLYCLGCAGISSSWARSVHSTHLSVRKGAALPLCYHSAFAAIHCILVCYYSCPDHVRWALAECLWLVFGWQACAICRGDKASRQDSASRHHDFDLLHCYSRLRLHCGSALLHPGTACTRRCQDFCCIFSGECLSCFSVLC